VLIRFECGFVCLKNTHTHTHTHKRKKTTKKNKKNLISIPAQEHLAS
jgi:hypothetical protein